MNDIEISMREMQETHDDISQIDLSSDFRREIDGIRLDLNVSPHVNLTFVQICHPGI